VTQQQGAHTRQPRFRGASAADAAFAQRWDAWRAQTASHGLLGSDGGLHLQAS